ncbi:MAG TPA: MbcA/ParS/Xre antitoxin family protein [Desulfuromonadaceae bacterium]|jgi:hypothetical protein
MRKIKAIKKLPCPGTYGSPPGPYVCDVCTREMDPGEPMVAVAFVAPAPEDLGLFCSDCESHVPPVYILSRAVDVFKDYTKAMLWFRTPCLALGGKIPADLATPAEVEKVISVLTRIEAGEIE